jgi:hypothetical protein
VRARVAARGLTLGLYFVLAVLVMALVQPAAALSSGEILLFRDTSTNCTIGGQNLYLTSSTNSLGAWGWNDETSGYKRGSASARLWANNNAEGSQLTTATWDCDLTNNTFPLGGNWSDKASSVSFP